MDLSTFYGRSEEELKAELEQLQAEDEAEGYCSGNCSSCGSDCDSRVTPRMAKKIIAIYSGKGGTGKSVITALLAAESVQKVQKNISFPLKAGDFAENILTEGICLYTLPVGTRLRIGPVLTEVTQIGKECHKGCAIRQLTGDCVMPREGIFVKVLEPGEVKPGDEIVVLPAGPAETTA